MKYNQALRKQINQRGSSLIMVAFFIVALFGFTALSIDVSHVFQEQRRAQIAADAASYAAAALLTNSSVSASAVIQEAQNIAAANGLTTAEILASNNGTIEVGQWNTNTFVFTAGTTPYNAVRVPARRSVPLSFGPVVGLGNMTPTVKSVTMIVPTGSALGENGAGLIPFAVHMGQATNAFYQPYSFTKGDIGSGNFGKLSLTDPTGANTDWASQMTDGCNCSLDIGTHYGDIPGNAGISGAFADRWALNPYAVMAIFADQGSGNSGHGDTIIGFVAVKILDVQGNGNWTITVENVPLTIAGGVGGGGPGPVGLPGRTRVLVQ